MPAFQRYFCFLIPPPLYQEKSLRLSPFAFVICVAWLHEGSFRRMFKQRLCRTCGFESTVYLASIRFQVFTFLTQILNLNVPNASAKWETMGTK
jgi:hypothetical protein